MTAAIYANLDFPRSIRPTVAISTTSNSLDAAPSALFFIDHPMFALANAEGLLLGGQGRMSGVVHRASRSVLTIAEEKSLFLEFNYCRFREAKASAAASGEGATDALQREVGAWHQAAIERRDRLVESNLGLVAMMIRNVRVEGTDYDELLSEGNLTLLNAVSKFDVNRGFRFSTYACQAIHHAIGLSMLRRRRRPWASLSEGLDIAANSEETGHFAEEIPRVTEMLRRNEAKLTVVELQVIRSRFALPTQTADDISNEPMTRLEIGRMVGLSKERIRQIERTALAKLRETMVLRYGHETLMA